MRWVDGTKANPLEHDARALACSDVVGALAPDRVLMCPLACWALHEEAGRCCHKPGFVLATATRLPPVTAKRQVLLPPCTASSCLQGRACPRNVKAVFSQAWPILPPLQVLTDMNTLKQAGNMNTIRYGGRAAGTPSCAFAEGYRRAAMHSVLQAALHAAPQTLQPQGTSSQPSASTSCARTFNRPCSAVARPASAV